MDYDYRNRATSPYDPPHRTSTSPYGQSLYPRVGQPQPQPGQALFPPSGSASRNHPSFHPPSSSSSSSSSGIGIRIILKPEYRIAPPPQLSPLVGNIPRSNFQFDFDFERKILAEAEKDTQNWSRLSLEHLPPKPMETASSSSLAADPVAAKYVASGLNREAVTLAVANYGDNPPKVQEFANGFNLLREMGFSSNNVAEALLMYDNDTDKALAHFLNSSA